jgi:hypothetical protein
VFGAPAAAVPAHLIYVLAGFTQSIYERSHKDGDIDAVKANMREVARLRLPGTHVARRVRDRR